MSSRLCEVPYEQSRSTYAPEYRSRRKADFSLLDRHATDDLIVAEAFSARQAIVADYPAEVLLRFDEILSETDAQSPCYLEKLKSALFALIIAYMRMIGSVSFLPMVDKTKRVDSRIAEIEKYVRAHMSEQVTLEDIAQHIHISTKQIGRILQRDFCLFRARLYRPVEM